MSEASGAGLPHNIRDMQARMAAMTESTIGARLDAGQTPELSATSIELLNGLLDNTQSLDHLPENRKPNAAEVVWRLGIASDLGSKVLQHAGAVLLVEDLDLPSVRFGEGSTPAQDLIKTRPDFLAHATPQETFAFWRLAGLRAEGFNIAGNFATVLNTLKHATFVPNDVVDKVRGLRDDWSPTDRSGEQITVNVGDSQVEVEGEQPSEHDAEVDESGRRLVCAAFVAKYSAQEDDQRYLQNAIEDFSYRAAQGWDGPARMLEALLALDNFGLQENNTVLTELLAPHINRLNQSLPELGERLRTRPVRSDELVAITETILAAHEQLGIAAASRLVEQLKPRIYALGELSVFDDPAMGVIDPYDSNGMQRLAEAHIVFESSGEISELISRLRGDEEQLSPQRFFADLQQRGFQFDTANKAMRLVAAELSPGKRTELCLRIEDALGIALTNLPEGSPYAGPAALQELLYNETAAELAYFKTGRNFLFYKIHEFERMVRADLTAGKLLENEQPDHAAFRALGTLCDGLWNNRYFYAEEERNHYVLQPIIDTSLELIKFALRNQVTPGAVQWCDFYNRNLNQYIIWLREHTGETPPALRHPLPDLLRSYTAPAETQS